MNQRTPLVIFALVMVAIPFVPGLPPFWIVLLDNIGLSALVAMGLVLLTGVGGLTSFGQAAFCGFGAYTTAVLTTTYGLSFASSIWRDNVVACQFHPEKSQSVGLRIVKNFGAWQ